MHTRCKSRYLGNFKKIDLLADLYYIALFVIDRDSMDNFMVIPSIVVPKFCPELLTLPNIDKIIFSSNVSVLQKPLSLAQ